MRDTADVLFGKGDTDLATFLLAAAGRQDLLRPLFEAVRRPRRGPPPRPRAGERQHRHEIAEHHAVGRQGGQHRGGH